MAAVSMAYMLIGFESLSLSLSFPLSRLMLPLRGSVLTTGRLPLSMSAIYKMSMHRNSTKLSNQ